MQKVGNRVIAGIILLFLAAFVVTWCTSCAAQPKMKRDCKGEKHYRQSNGVYL